MTKVARGQQIPQDRHKLLLFLGLIVLFCGIILLHAEEKTVVKDFAGEDRFNLKFSTGEELTIRLLRKTNGCFDIQSNGAWVDAQGKKTPLAIGDLSVISREKWKSSKTGIIYPTKWEVRIPKFKVDVRLQPTLPDQEVQIKETTFWKGACKVSGSHIGRAQVELTGYRGLEMDDLKLENKK